MKKKRHFNEKPEFIRELEARQQNIWWHDRMRNALMFTRFWWHGSSDATVVQRVGMALLGIGILGSGFTAFYSLGFPAIESDLSVFVTIPVALLFASPFLIIAYRLLRNAFKR